MSSSPVGREAFVIGMAVAAECPRGASARLDGVDEQWTAVLRSG